MKVFRVITAKFVLSIKNIEHLREYFELIVDYSLIYGYNIRERK